ncbi:glycosyltransferase family 2 protein, partial [Candidatus Woesearchaeota archaeon]
MVEYSILVPIYNEQDAVKDTLERCKKVAKELGECEIIAINDGSKDNTASVLKTIKGIRKITHPYNLGYGASLKDGLRASKGKWIIITDSDGTYPIEDALRLAKYAGEYDMVVGARTGKEVHIPLLRRPAKWIIGKLANFLAGRKIVDINSGLRIFDREKATEFIKLYPSGFSFTTTITLAFFTNDYTVKYIPINYYKRKGKSTIHPIKDFIGFIALIFRIIIYFKPLKFFIIPSLALILFGIAWGVKQALSSPAGLGQLP